MANPPQAVETDLHRIVLFDSPATRLLVIPENGRFRLPTLAAPKHQRLAESLTALLTNQWSQQAVCLFRLDTSLIAPDLHYHVMACSDENLPITPGSRWVSVPSLEEGQFQTAPDYAAVVKSFAECRAYAEGCKLGSFARPGWFSELTAWVRDEAAREGLRLSGRFSQLNGSPTFSLVRFETNGPALWFKAVGEPNLREYTITLELSKYLPSFVPPALAARSEWNGWLALEVPGTHPDEGSPRTVWARVAEALADVQLASLGRTLHLLDAGCRDARVCSLVDLVEPFIAVMKELMEQQTQKVPAALSHDELALLETRLHQVLSHATACDFPNTIGHFDCNPGNIVVSADRCVFLDWAEGCVGHPFITFQYLLEHIRRSSFLDNSGELALTGAYLNRWQEFLSPDDIGQALAISPLLAAFAYGVCTDAWRNPGRRERPETARHLRSLTRRLKREADCLLVATAERGAP